MIRLRRVALAWTLIVLVLHLIPRSQLERVPGSRDLLYRTWPDKLAHVLMFALLGWLWARAAPAHLGRIVGAGIVYGGFLEVLQHTVVPGRSGSLDDLLCDALGLVLAAAFARRRNPVAPGAGQS